MSLAIPSGLTRDMDSQDINKLMASYQIIEQSRNSLLDGSISIDEYCHLCEKHDMNVDDYMETIEHNLIQLNLI